MQPFKAPALVRASVVYLTPGWENDIIIHQFDCKTVRENAAYNRGKT